MAEKAKVCTDFMAFLERSRVSGVRPTQVQELDGRVFEEEDEPVSVHTRLVHDFLVEVEPLDEVEAAASGELALVENVHLVLGFLDQDHQTPPQSHQPLDLAVIASDGLP